MLWLCAFRDLRLKEPIYQKTAVYGHFGRPEFPWEQPKKLTYWEDNRKYHSEITARKERPKLYRFYPSKKYHNILWYPVGWSVFLVLYYRSFSSICLSAIVSIILWCCHQVFDGEKRPSLMCRDLLYVLYCYVIM